MKNKYYAPDLADFYVGYQCEMKNSSDENYFNWEICTFKNDFSNHLNKDYCFEYLYKDLKDNNIRTKYLDKEDVESLGWKYTGKSIDIWFEKEGDYELSTWNSNKAYLQYGLHDTRLTISFDDAGKRYQVFQGECKSINELKKILKYLKIE